SGWHLALIHRSNFNAELCQYRNNAVAIAGFSCPNPISRPFDTDTDSDTDTDTDPELASRIDLSSFLPLQSLSHRWLWEGQPLQPIRFS
ncbi:MAG TPA: hypothetical protein DEW46_14325, partial [Verrucomicrobia bacterium]|nr:hypothetical protein [Verrucomicrobiota bacterium]